MEKIDPYEIPRLLDIIENYQETINRHAPDISFCSQCEFAKNEDDLTDVDEGDMMYCKSCLESFIASNDVDCCEECQEYHTTEVDGIDTESEEE